MNTRVTPPLAALFDLDGTLVDTIEDLTDTANLMLTDMARPTLPLETIHRFVGKGIFNLVTRCMAEDKPATETDIQTAFARFKYHYSVVNGRRAKAYPGVQAALEDLAARGVLMGVVTNKAAEFSESLLEKMGLKHFFKIIISGDTLPEKKPDPTPLRYACEVLGVSIDDCVMFGDSANDALAAQAAGMSVFLLDYGYSEGCPIDTIACDGLLSSIQQAWPLLTFS